MNTPIEVKWFDGSTAQLHEALMIVSTDAVEIVGRDGGVLHRATRAQVQPSDRIGDTAIRIQFEGGGLALTDDAPAVARAFPAGQDASWTTKAERQPVFVVFALIATVGLLVAAYHYLIPAISGAIAMRVPRAAEHSIGKIALEGADRLFLKSTLLPTIQKRPTEQVFSKLAKEAGLDGVVNLQFRDFDPNALAIPGGTIVMTDGMVKILNNEERLLAAVIAHELGHIHHRHSLRRMLEGSASALIVSAVSGDASGMTAVATSAPLLLSTLKYTRDGEYEADRFAHALLKKAGYSPKDFADAMRKLEDLEICYQIRSDQRNKDKPFGGLFSDDEDDKISTEETSEDSDAVKVRRNAKRAINNKRKLCVTGLDWFLTTHAAEVEEIRKSKPKHSGYLSSHPATRERIETADRTALQK